MSAVVGWRRIRPLSHGAAAKVRFANSLMSSAPFTANSAVRSALAALQREKQILSSLDSPYVVSYVGEINHSFKEYAPGVSVVDEIVAYRGRMHKSLIKLRTRDILRGLSYLHNAGIAHCDVKPDNVLIAADGHAMLGDLGYVRYLDQHWDTRTRGTPLFMAPEVLQREMQGREADIWALGCTVMEMATGGLPWSYANYDLHSILNYIAVGDGLPELPNWISEEMKDFMGRCLKRDPKQRWTADELLKHPFVSNYYNFNKRSCGVFDYRCESPTGVLDRDLFDYANPTFEEIQHIVDGFSFLD